MMRAPVMPNGWPRAMAPPWTLSLSAGDAELPGRGDDLGGERLVDLDQVDVVDGHAGPAERLAAGLDRSEAHDLGVEGRDAARTRCGPAG